MKYIFVELVRRLIQILFGAETFEFPVLSTVRNFFYRLVFDIGKTPTIGRNVRLYRVHGLKQGKIKIGENVLLANNVEINYSGDIKIGDNIWISEGAQIHSRLHELTKERTNRNKDKIHPIKIIIEKSVGRGKGYPVTYC